jgi:ribosomal protein L12E/L44/L45/RPP1/RPP2
MAKANYTEQGSSGLVTFSGIIQDEFLRELRGKEGYKRFDEMRRNSPIIGALLLANELAIRKVSWNFESAEDEAKKKQAEQAKKDKVDEDEYAAEPLTRDPRIELLEASRDNMSTSWNDFITEALTMLPFGYSLFEVCYERVESAILWRKFAPRGQDTIYRWNLDETGGLAGVIQQAAPKYQTIDLPIEKLLLFRTRVERGNPEGRSILRTAWIPYYYAKHIQQVEAIGIERDLAGLPKIMLPQGADTSDTDASDYGVARKLVRNVRNDEQAGLVLPYGWEFELVSTGGSRQFDTDKIVRRYESRMLMSALAQFIMLGQDGVGSLALSKDMSDFFTMAVNAVADIISETFTKYAIPRLLSLNGYDAEGISLTHTPAGDVDTGAIADFLQKVGGYVTWDAADELWLRQLIGLPEKDVEELQAQRDEADAAKAEAARAIAEGMAKGKEKDGEEKPKEEKSKEGEYTIARYASSPPDEAARLRMERRLKKLVAAHMEKTKRKVIRYAKEVRR